MENIVAVAVELDSGETRYFLTWGRIQDAVDPRPLEALVLVHSVHYSLGGRMVRSRLCDSLQEASGEPAFYECFFGMCQQRIPFGEDSYQQWRSEMNERMHRGKEIYYLGRKHADHRDTHGHDQHNAELPRR